MPSSRSSELSFHIVSCNVFAVGNSPGNISMSGVPTIGCVEDAVPVSDDVLVY